MQNTPDGQLSDEVIARIREAEAFLRAEMTKLGLLEADGWRIAQSTRDVMGATEIVLRPMHLRKSAPEGLECVVRVHEVQQKVETECAPPDDA
jgi:hypothetical protein